MGLGLMPSDIKGTQTRRTENGVLGKLVGSTGDEMTGGWKITAY